ncbi:MAG TPA: ABC transporter ATP-binding protein [Saprospiraceae bacterium]|nr:ABC transporter ATP-binding protein [Saprospiraceae bacterium]
MTQEKQKEKKSLDWKVLKRLLKLAFPYKQLLIFSALLAIILAPLNTAQPYLVNVIVDDYIINPKPEGLVKMCLLFAGLLILTGILQYTFIYLTNLIGHSVIRDLRVSVFSKITGLKLSYFDKTPIGNLTTRTINDIETIKTVFSEGVITIVADLLSIVVVLAVMFYTSPQLTLICLSTIPLILIATWIFKQKVKVSYQKVRTHIARLNAFLQERISGMQVVQIFNAQEQERQKFKEINRDYTKANLDSILYYAIFFPVVEIIAALALGIMVWWGARNVVSGSVTMGELIAFPLYINMLFRPMRWLADKFNTLQMGMVAGERIFNILDSTEVMNETAQPVLGTPEKKGIVEFDHVHFSYDEENDVLKDVSFKIESGDTLAIVGSTGSGKSTIINLLNRFYDIQKGSIRVDGQDIRDYELEDLRKRIAIVLQDVFLFSGSVWENISLRNKEILHEEILEASKIIGAHSFIQEMPGGYDFVISERGGNLSMGQRQLISFVRALVYDPEILILDEATSSIDTETESIIQYAIEKLIAKRTSIIIAHRLSTIRHANHILVLDKGKVVEYGTHDELLRIESGKYRKLYNMQFRVSSVVS